MIVIMLWLKRDMKRFIRKSVTVPMNGKEKLNLALKNEEGPLLIDIGGMPTTGIHCIMMDAFKTMDFHIEAAMPKNMDFKIGIIGSGAIVRNCHLKAYRDAGDINNYIKSKVTGNLGFSLIPGKSPVLGGWNLSLNAYTRHKKEAENFLLWACAAQNAIPLSLLGGSTLRQDYYNRTDLENLKPWKPYTIWRKIFRTIIQNILMRHFFYVPVSRRNTERINTGLPVEIFFHL